MTFWAASGFLWQHLASIIKNKIKQGKSKAICYHNLVFTVLKEHRVASSQKIHQGRCFTFIEGQRDNCLYSEMNLPLFYIPWDCLKLKICCFLFSDFPMLLRVGHLFTPVSMLGSTTTWANAFKSSSFARLSPFLEIWNV